MKQYIASNFNEKNLHYELDKTNKEFKFIYIDNSMIIIKYWIKVFHIL